ncbi:EAL domain-containing protein [Ruminococcus sp. NK3A76]|uniref:putative bifunctional diguanylate cyclase/phosphodiesterase n=1 Tax=Ruminococcus sp. NK3A76 TaxID=877411 RepID=UPI0004904C4F|nr:EAL domain-containing protein [Ruminococcus sp. NK3A76]
MTDLKKRKKRRKKLLKSKKGGVVASFFVFIIFAAMLLSLFVVMASMTSEASIKNTLIAELDKATIVRRSYASNDGDEAIGILEKSEIDYILLDKQGNVISQSGKDTRKKRGGKFLHATSFSSEDETLSNDELLKKYTYTLYGDSENDVISIDEVPEDEPLDEADPIDINGFRFFKEVIRTLDSSDVNGDPSDGSDDFSEGFKDGYNKDQRPVDMKAIMEEKDSVQLPVWVQMDIPEKEQTVYFRCVISMNILNLSFLIELLVFSGVVIAIMFIAFIVMIIRGLLNIRRMRNLLFTDIKVDGRNWLWFVYNAESTLSKHKNANKNFALIDLEFIGYRRFCVCNSVDEGEVLLKNVAKKLRGYVDKKELCAHNAEDSFALMLRYTDDESFKNRLEMILSALSDTVQNNSLAFHAGVFLLPALDGGFFAKRKNVDTETDFINASAACATLADNSGNAVMFYNDKLVEEQKWINTVTQTQQKALDNEEFIVYYQPKYDPRTHELRGAEALIRWQSPEYGFLSPYKFIPIFENNGFITKIDHYMISHVARDQRKWLDLGLKCVPVSVNVSRAHFIESDLAEQIRDIVDAEGTPHEYIEIELTESAFFDDKDAMVETINRLKGYGFAVSMDDFGSGYSSLNSLKDMPLDVLKLDAEFFRGEAADTERGELVVSEAIRLAKNLDMRTVAEGVEVKEQVEFLASQGCDMIQGYYFAKPMPHDEYEERIRKGRSDGKDEESLNNE